MRRSEDRSLSFTATAEWVSTPRQTDQVQFRSKVNRETTLSNWKYGSIFKNKPISNLEVRHVKKP